jgi:hypothetical protein
MYLFRKKAGILSANLNLIIMVQTYNIFLNLRYYENTSAHYTYGIKLQKKPGITVTAFQKASALSLIQLTLKPDER